VRVTISQCMQNNLDVSFYSTVYIKFFVVVYLNNTVSISTFINVYQPLQKGLHKCLSTITMFV
jgi:hypothetical protein